MYGPVGIGSQGSPGGAERGSFFNKDYTNAPPEEDFLPLAFAPPAYSPVRGRASIESEGGRRPYEWTERDTAADRIVSLSPEPDHPSIASPPAEISQTVYHNVPNAPQAPIAYQPPSYQNVSPSFPSPFDGREPVSPIEDPSSRKGNAWWKIALVLLFAIVAAVLWVQLINLGIKAFAPGAVASAVTLVVLAVLFTASLLLMLGFWV